MWAVKRKWCKLRKSKEQSLEMNVDAEYGGRENHPICPECKIDEGLLGETTPSLLLAGRRQGYRHCGCVSTLAPLGSKSNEMKWSIH